MNTVNKKILLKTRYPVFAFIAMLGSAMFFMFFFVLSQSKSNGLGTVEHLLKITDFNQLNNAEMFGNLMLLLNYSITKLLFAVMILTFICNLYSLVLSVIKNSSFKFEEVFLYAINKYVFAGYLTVFYVYTFTLFLGKWFVNSIQSVLDFAISFMNIGKFSSSYAGLVLALTLFVAMYFFWLWFIHALIRVDIERLKRKNEVETIMSNTTDKFSVSLSENK